MVYVGVQRTLETVKREDLLRVCSDCGSAKSNMPEKNFLQKMRSCAGLNNNMDSHIQPELVKALKDMGYAEFTEIQLKAIPLIKAVHDVIDQVKNRFRKDSCILIAYT